MIVLRLVVPGVHVSIAELSISCSQALPVHRSCCTDQESQPSYCESTCTISSATRYVSCLSLDEGVSSTDMCDYVYAAENRAREEQKTSDEVERKASWEFTRKMSMESIESVGSVDKQSVSGASELDYVFVLCFV